MMEPGRANDEDGNARATLPLILLEASTLMGRPVSASAGKLLKHQPAGAPLFYVSRRLPRVVTSDPWAFLRYEARRQLGKEKARQVSAFVDQAFDFFEAAANPRTSSRPLLYYYSFLNLAKAFILIRRSTDLPLLLRHGISDPRANTKQRLRFAGQRVRIENLAADHSQLFPEFLNAFDGASCAVNECRVIDLLKQIPGIHRTCCSVLGDSPAFCPVEGFEFFSDGGSIWTLMKLDKTDKDVTSSLPKLRRSRRFQSIFTQVESTSDSQIWFETRKVQGQRRGIDGAIAIICRNLRKVGFHAILTQRGYRYYAGNFNPGSIFPQLASVYAAMFYLGSITRYKPHYFGAIVSKGNDWLVAELLETQPMQFLYLLSSFIAGVEVIKPHATISHG